MSLKVVQSDPEIPVEVLATAIEKLSKASAQLNASRLLNRKAILLLLHDVTKVPKRDIEYILNAIPELERIYLKKKPA